MDGINGLAYLTLSVLLHGEERLSSTQLIDMERLSLVSLQNSGSYSRNCIYMAV